MPGHKQVNSQNDICSTFLVTERNLTFLKTFKIHTGELSQDSEYVILLIETRMERQASVEPV